jgi:excisionase family DNA binding protein
MMAGAIGERTETPPAHGTGEPALLTPEEVAARLRVTRRTVYAWLKVGRLRGLRAGKGWRIRPADLEAFLLPSSAWEARLDDSLARSRSQAPDDLSEAEITAALEAAREEVHQKRRARGH